MSVAWRTVLVRDTDTADKALRVLDAGGLRVALVTDVNERLVGIVTDGDIRRALLRHQSFSESVTQIMNPRPLTMQPGTTPEVLRSFMKQRSMMHLPIVDQIGRLIGLETFSELLSPPRRENWVLLMAGGGGTRLKPLTDNCPKPLLLVGGKPVLETIIENFLAAGFHRFFISVHYHAQQIRDYFGDGSRWNATVHYVEEDTPLGTAGALGLLDDVGGKPVMMINGDVLTSVNFNSLLDFHENAGATMTVCVREYEMQVPFGVVEGENSVVRKIIEKPVHRFFVNAGVYVVAPEVIAAMHPVRRIDMPHVIGNLVGEHKVAMFPIHEYWIDIGRPEDFWRAQREIPE